MAGHKPDQTQRWDLVEDRALVTRFRDGDRAALEQVFRAYLPLVLHLVVRGVMLETGGRAFVMDTTTQDDLVQEVFLRLFEPATRARYDGLRPYAPLVRTVARNVVVDHLRKHGKDSGRLVALPEVDLETLAEPQGGGPEQSLLDGEEAALMKSFMGELSDEERALVELRFARGASQEQAARALGKTRQNIRTLEERLKDRLRAALRRAWGR